MHDIELTIEQSQKTDKLLEKLLDGNGMGKDEVDVFFKNDDETLFVCRILEKMELVNLLGASYFQPFTILTPNGGIATLLDSGGLTKIATDRENERTKKAEREAKSDKLLDLDLKLKQFESRIGKKIVVAGIIITVLNLLISVLAPEFRASDDKQSKQKNQVEKQEPTIIQSKLKDSLN